MNFKGLQLIISLPIFGCLLVLRINIVSSLLCCGVGIVPCLFNLLYYIIWWLHPSSTPRTSSGSTCEHLPHPSQEESLKVRYPSVCARRCDQDVLLFCSVICWWHPQIVSRVIMHVSNANLFKKMVCLSFNTITIWPCLLHVRKSFRPSTQHNLSRLPSSETVLSRHSQRNGNSEELDAAVGHFFFYFSMVRRPQLCFTCPRRWM